MTGPTATSLTTTTRKEFESVVPRSKATPPTTRGKALPSNSSRRKQHARRTSSSSARSRGSKSCRSKYSSGSTLFHVDEDGTYFDDMSKFAFSEVDVVGTTTKHSRGPSTPTRNNTTKESELPVEIDNHSPIKQKPQQQPQQRRPSIGASSLGDASLYTTLTNEDNTPSIAATSITDVCLEDAYGNPIFFDHENNMDDADLDEVMSFVSALTVDSSFPRFFTLPVAKDGSFREYNNNNNTDTQSATTPTVISTGTGASCSTTAFFKGTRRGDTTLQLEDLVSVASKNSTRSLISRARRLGYITTTSAASVYSTTSVLSTKDSLRKQKLASMDVMTNSSRTTTSKTEEAEDDESSADRPSFAVAVESPRTAMVANGNQRTYQVDPILEDRHDGAFDRLLRLLVGCLGSEKLQAALDAAIDARLQQEAARKQLASPTKNTVASSSQTPTSATPTSSSMSFSTASPKPVPAPPKLTLRQSSSNSKKKQKERDEMSVLSGISV